MDKCEKCKIKKDYAKMGFHWFDEEDCPYECPFDERKSENENERT